MRLGAKVRRKREGRRELCVHSKSYLHKMVFSMQVDKSVVIVETEEYIDALLA